MSVSTSLVALVCRTPENAATACQLSAFSAQLTKRGLVSILIHVQSRSELQQALQNAAALPVTHLLFLSSVCDDEQSLAAEILPAVAQLHADAQTLASDRYSAGEALALLLLSQGHQRTGFMHAGETPEIARQLAGVNAGLQTQEKEVQLLLTAGRERREEAYQSMMAYLKKTRAAERINALVCSSDELAFGALQAVRDFGQGAHVAVTGYGNVAEAAMSTWHLTRWAPRSDLRVTETLNRLLEQGADNNSGWQQGELEVRHSHQGKYIPGEMSQCGCAIRH
ncbi:substrate-binding domain-containing protein [Pantoea sp. UBA4549]|uniref:substrate-binding domain-containing protein n=1 Tax=Pantoea sp. UBA4549 TaxID=1947033 RepID=UPI0025D7640B|nr:substrate-binding domain-containing protein [Pantoea sp. UBA4549]